MDKRANRSAWLGLGVSLLSWGAVGCSGTLSRIAGPSGNPAGPPRIDRIEDLGSLPLSPQGPLDLQQADGLLTPGEWIAIRGKNLLGRIDARIGGVSARIGGYLTGDGLLLQVPRGLPVGTQELSVDNGLGRAQANVQTASYVVVADAEANQVAFRRLQIEVNDQGPRPGFADTAPVLNHSKARFVALSADAGLLYVLSEPSGEASSSGIIGASLAIAPTTHCELLIVHMGAKNGPKAAVKLPLDLPGAPTAMAMGSQGVLAITTSRAVTALVTADSPLAPRVLPPLGVVTDAEPRALTAAAFLHDGKTLAVLEAYGNDVYTVDVSNLQAPRVASKINLSGSVGEPYSIDLSASPDGASLWVLQGPNFRLAGKRLRDGLKGAWGAATSLQWKRAGRSLGGIAAPSQGAGHSRLLRLAGGPQSLEISDEVTLPPTLLPFSIRAQTDAVYVSALHGENPFQDIDASLAGIQRLFSALRSTVQVGQVLRVHAQTGQVQAQVQGLAMYGDLATLPGGGLLIGTLRLGPGYLPPRLTLDFGFEIAGGRFSKHREVANTAFGLVDAVQRLTPPYRIDRIAAQ